jgi:hypothetical protein
MIIVQKKDRCYFNSCRYNEGILGSCLRNLNFILALQIFERLTVAAGEISDVGNNAGTGRLASFELNY